MNDGNTSVDIPPMPPQHSLVEIRAADKGEHTWVETEMGFVHWVPGVRADGLRGLAAGRSRGYPRVSSGSDTIGDSIPASGRYTTII